MKKFLIVIFISLLLISPSSFAGEVIMIGQGITKEIAIHNAMRLAVEKEVGAIIDSETYTKNYQTISDEINLKSRGYIESYEIIREIQSGEFIEVEIKAIVRSEELKTNLMNRLEKKKIVDTNLNDPRIAVIAFDESGGNYPSIENEIIKAMKNQGFNHIVDLKQVNSSVKMRLKNAENDLALIRSIQNQFHFDNLIVAQIVNDNSASTLSVKMISMNTGEIIFADSFISNQNRMFTKNNPSRTIKNLSRQAAFAVSNAALNQAALIEQHITILVTKNTLDKFGQNIQNLNKRIKTIRNVNDIFTRNINNGVAELDINFDGTTYELMTELKRIGFNIIEMNSNYIKI